MRELMVLTHLDLFDQEGITRFELMALTGFSRRSIRLLLADRRKGDHHDLIGRFMAHWFDDQKSPKTLQIEPNGFPSFYHLHDKYGSDFTIPGLLKLLKNYGLVKIEKEKVTALGRSVTARTSVDKLAAAKMAIGGLLSTLTHNLYDLDPPLLQHRVYVQTASVEQKAQMRGQVADAVNQSNKKINQLMARHKSRKRPKAQENKPELGLGIYWYKTKEAQPALEEDAAKG